jgi:hypothetical protein
MDNGWTDATAAMLAETSVADALLLAAARLD